MYEQFAVNHTVLIRARKDQFCWWCAIFYVRWNDLLNDTMRVYWHQLFIRLMELQRESACCFSSLAWCACAVCSNCLCSFFSSPFVLNDVMWCSKFFPHFWCAFQANNNFINNDIIFIRDFFFLSLSPSPQLVSRFYFITFTYVFWQSSFTWEMQNAKCDLFTQCMCCVCLAVTIAKRKKEVISLHPVYGAWLIASMLKFCLHNHAPDHTTSRII